MPLRPRSCSRQRTQGSRFPETLSAPAESPLAFLTGRFTGSLILRPALLHRRYQSTIRVIVDGEPRVIVNRVLPDIDVLREGKSETAKVIDSSRRRFRITPLSVWAVLLALAIVALFVGPIVYNFDQQAFLPLGVVSLLLASLSLLSVIIIAIYRLIRWIGRNIEARSGLR